MSLISAAAVGRDGHLRTGAQGCAQGYVVALGLTALTAPDTAKPAPAPRRRFPCEDLELEPIAPAAPKPAFQRDLPIESDYFEELVMTWSFLNIFGSVRPTLALV